MIDATHEEITGLGTLGRGLLAQERGQGWNQRHHILLAP